MQGYIERFMKYFQPLPIEVFINDICQQDRDISKILESWNVELEEVTKAMSSYYTDLGIYMVEPLAHADLIRGDLFRQLRDNKLLKQKLHAVHEESIRLKKNTQSGS